MQKRQDDEKMEGAGQAGQEDGAGTPRHRAGEKRYRSSKDHLDQIDYCPDIKFGSFTIVSVPAELQRWGSSDVVDVGEGEVVSDALFHVAPSLPISVPSVEIC